MDHDAALPGKTALVQRLAVSRNTVRKRLGIRGSLAAVHPRSGIATFVTLTAAPSPIPQAAQWPFLPGRPKQAPGFCGWNAAREGTTPLPHMPDQTPT